MKNEIAELRHAVKVVAATVLTILARPDVPDDAYAETLAEAFKQLMAVAKKLNT